MLMGHIGNDADGKRNPKHPVLGKAMGRNFQHHMRIAMRDGLPQILLDPKRARRRHMEPRVIRLAANHRVNGRNHGGAKPCCLEDFVDKRRCGRFSVRSRHADDGELFARKSEPYDRKRGDEEMIHALYQSNHCVHYSMLRGFFLTPTGLFPIFREECFCTKTRP